MIPTETPLQTEVGESWKPHRRTDQQLRMGGEGEGRCCISGEKFHRADRAHENVHPVLFSVSEFVEQIFKRAGRPSPSELAEVNRYSPRISPRSLRNFANRSLYVSSARIYDVCEREWEKYPFSRDIVDRGVPLLFTILHPVSI